MGRGNVNGFYMLLGEAPGRNEALTGLPFMGQAGKLLDRVASATGMLKYSYITNVAKCRPPNNRAPTRDEMLKCSPYFLKEVEIVRPIIVVAMGGTAMRLLGIKRRGEMQDWEFDTKWKPWGMIGTYHPAYCLPGRAGKSGERVLRRHMELARDRLLDIVS